MTKSGQQLLEDARRRVREISAADALALHGQDGVTFLDVRDAHEVNLGKIPGATHVSRGNLESKVEAAVPRTARVVVYCANGNRSVFAAATLQEMGYDDVASLSGGYRGWAEQGGEIED